MKANVILIVALVIQNALFAQDTKLTLSPEQMSQYLAEVFGSEFEQNTPETARAFKDLINDRIVLRYQPEQEYEKYPKLSVYPLNNKNNPDMPAFTGADFDIQTFNPLRYGLDFFPTYPQVARLDSTPYIIIVYPQ